jgi:hypothetical protein
MGIARSPCSGGPLREGNRTQEADRRLGTNLVAKGLGALDCERVSLSVSEPESASLHKVGAVNRPDTVKPDTCREATGVCTCKTPRGERGKRARKDGPRNLGDPLRRGVGTTR